MKLKLFCVIFNTFKKFWHAFDLLIKGIWTTLLFHKTKLFLLFFLCPFSIFANQPYQIKLISPFKDIQKDTPFPVALWIQLKPNWYTYWSHPGDFGKALKANWNAPPYIKISSPIFPSPQRYTYKIGDQNYSSFIYKKEVLIPFEVLVDEQYNNKEVLLLLDLEFFICKDICISKKEKLSLNLPISKKFKFDKEHQQLFQVWKLRQPQEIDIKSHFQQKDGDLLIQFQFKNNLECLDLLPHSTENFSSHKPSLLNQTQNSCSFKVKQSASLPVVSGLLSYKHNNILSSVHFKSYEKKTFGLFWFILMAFLGGLLLNIMPCVLPIIFLKFYNTIELAHKPKIEILKLNLSYVTGIISSFLILALVIFMSKKAGESIGWGFHLQSPLFITVLSLLFICMAFYLLDLFTFPLPKITLNFQNENLVSHFVTGILSTTAASPCTVPFMASAVGFAFSRSIVEVFAIFFFLGLGLGSPYIVLSFFPKLLQYIPKKGIDKVKPLLSIPLFLTVVWLVYLLFNQLDPYVFFVTLFVFPLILLIFLIQKFMHKSYVYLKHTIAVILFLFICVILFFQWNTQPVTSYNIQDTTYSIPIKGENWNPFSIEQIQNDRENGASILVAIGAKWCLTCKFNERIFEDKNIQDFFKTNQVQLYYGDWTNRNPYITKFLNSYGQSGIPFYIIYKGQKQTQILPNLLFKERFLKALKDNL